MPSAAWRTERGSGGGIRTRTVASFEEADSADWSTPPWIGTPGAIRTRTSCGLNAVTPANWSTGAWCPPRGIEPGTCCLQGNCSAAELGGRKNEQTAAATRRGCRQPVSDRSRCQTAGPDGSKHARARIRETFRSRRGSWWRTHASAKRVTHARTASRSLTWNSAGLYPPACRRRASPAAGLIRLSRPLIGSIGAR